MNKSDSINELAAAMSNFQGEINNVFKASQGHGYNYADLGSILDQVRPILKKNGLSVVQLPISGDNKSVGVSTLLAHSSGQWIEQEYFMAIPENKRNSIAQNIGSAITYARRYALASVLGIAQTDNDASAESKYIRMTIEEYDALSAEEKGRDWGNVHPDDQIRIKEAYANREAES